MDGNSGLYGVDIGTGEPMELTPCSASEIQVREKQIEEWVATSPELLFTDPNAVMVIAQEIAGELQADLLAVDSQGSLIIIEIKRHASDRRTVGQLLDYASSLAEWDYDAFQERYQRYKGEPADLLEDFRAFVENPAFAKSNFLRERRLFILSSGTDESMLRTIRWLRESYGVPIDYVPITFFSLGDEVFLQIEKIELAPVVIQGTWAGDWFFNTDETHKPNAYRQMFAQSVIAAFGYGHAKSKHKMDLPAQGERVFAYVNGAGVCAVGKIEGEESYPASTVFGQEDGDECHRNVRWEVTVAEDRASTAQEVSEWGYNLPIRCTIGKMGNSKVAAIIARELRKRVQED